MKKLRAERERELIKFNEERRMIIINAAEELFMDKGIEETKMDDIASKVEISKATLYKVFASKDQLFLSVAKRAFDKLLMSMKTELSKNGAIYEIRTLGNAYVNFVIEYPDYAKFINVGKLTPLFNEIYGKMAVQEEFTESEAEFMSTQTKIADIFIEITEKTLKNAGVKQEVDIINLVIALSNFGMIVQELALTGLSQDETGTKARENLSMIFNIIDKGLKHYDDTSRDFKR